MRNLSPRWVKFVLGIALSSGIAGARPGELRRSGGDASLEVLDPMATGRTCMIKGAVCITSGAAETIAAAQPLASTGALPASPPVFQRVGVAATAIEAVGAAPWTLELDAYTSLPAVKGNTLFLFYDLAAPDAVAKQEVTGIHHGQVLPGRALSARIKLSPDDGFRAAHAYHVRIVQLLGGREVLLAQGDFSLR
ncbi:MAG: hypothetical protein EXR72_14910 [Myxococcales bacterium]|nr:hypothetical protein [Myxococcales bacterium]